MLEFYYKFCRSKFKVKAQSLYQEILSILIQENITILNTDTVQIDELYQIHLGRRLYSDLNNLYFTIRSGKAKKHFLLKKYLPESKHEPDTQFGFGDFFSGAGGLGKGLVNAGFKPIFVNDIYLEALESYYFNHDLSIDHFFSCDIRTIVENLEEYTPLMRNIRLIAGGPPCQGFSLANQHNFVKDPETKEKRFIEDKRNILYKDFIKVLGRMTPDFFIIENVRGMMRVEKEIEEDIRSATSQEYHFTPMLLDAQSFGIPQSRQRYFLIGGKDRRYIKQIEQNFAKRQKAKLHYKLSDALYGLPPIESNPFKLDVNFESEINGYDILKKPLKVNSFIKSINRSKDIGYVLNHRSRFNNENDLNIFRLLPEGENSLHPSISHLNKYSSRNHIFKDKYFKLKLNEVSKTITSHMAIDCHMYIHPTQYRGLSPREAARLQTFPDDYLFRGTLNEWYRQIGNAVPVKLAEIIGKEIMNFYK